MGMGWLEQVGWLGNGWDGMSLSVGIAAQCKVCSFFADVRIFSTRPGAFREGLKVF